MVEMKYRMPPIAGVLPTLLYAQNFPSLLVGRLLSPRPFDRVCDMCSAPGGKAVHLAMLMNLRSSEELPAEKIACGGYVLGGEVPKGTIIAMERSKTRANELNATVEEMGVHDRIHVIHTDAAKCVQQVRQQA
jgi:16S rRNA C967 or C1407 C5-methylase (RsmB/RsmF family)